MRRPFLLALLLLASRPACAQTAPECPALFAAGRAPLLLNAKLAARTVPLCFEAFAVLHSGIARTPLYAAERLTRASVTAARRVDRVDAFHEEEGLPDDDRARLSDYLRSGFDRGHLAPAADMPTPTAQGESFSLANIVPQDRTVNRGVWASIEESVRRLALRRGTLFVVTGPVFSGDSVAAIDGRVLVPTQLFKAVYDPASGEAGAYLTANTADGEWRAVSLATLREIGGLDVFPDLPDGAKATAMALPEPHEFTRDGRRREPSFTDMLKRELYRAARRLWRELLREIFR